MTFTPDPDNCGHCAINAPHSAADHDSPAAEAVEREVVSVGLDGRSNPMWRYRDELALPDHARSIVDPTDRPDYSA